LDGVTTNGVLVMHIDGDQFNTNSKPTKWKEVSVGGNIFDLGEGRLKFNYQTAVNIQKKRNECNIRRYHNIYLVAFEFR
jgi:photosystem II stability/assembly factor-like uncharacterized protein